MAYKTHNDLLARYMQDLRLQKPDGSGSASRKQMRSAPVRNRRPDAEGERDAGRLSSAHSSHVEFISPFDQVHEDSVGGWTASSEVMSVLPHRSPMKVIEQTSRNGIIRSKLHTARQLSSLSCISEKTESSSSSRLGTVSNQTSSLTSQRAVSKKSKVSSGVWRPTLNALPDELLLKIFCYLTPGDLLSSARVNKNWLRLMNDNILWHGMFLRYMAPAKKNVTSETSVCRPPLYWKQKCLSRCDDFCPDRVLRQLTKLHRFTGLPIKTQPVLEKLSVRWVLAMVNAEGQETFAVFHNDFFYFQMSLCIRWYSSDMKIDGVRRLRVYAARPVFRDSRDKPLDNSPCRRSLLMETEFYLSSLLSSLTPVAEDKMLSLYVHNGGLIFAVWKECKDLAFVAVSLHAHQLVQRCILANSDSVFVPPKCKVLHDDIDTEYGLHGFSCTLEVRNLRNSLWSQQFGTFFCHRKDIADGWAVFTLINPEHNYERSRLTKKICTPWKTEALTGKLLVGIRLKRADTAISEYFLDVGIIDCTLLDEHKNPMWCTSLTAAVHKYVNGNLLFEYDGNDIEQLEFTDPDRGRIDIRLIRESSELCFITSIQLFLRTSFINSWFSTAY